MKAKRKHREETPEFLKPLSMLEPMYKGDIQKDIRAEISRYKELNSRSAVKKFKNKSNIFDLERAMEKRRVQALLNSVNEMPPEYQKYAGDWITLNIVAENYSSLDGEYHIMTAAAIWILDQLYESGASPQDVYQLLPRDADLLEELYAFDLCDTQFDEELIASVEYVLRNRNRDIAPLEDDGNDGKRYFTSILAAEGKAHGDVPSRKNFEALLGMIMLIIVCGQKACEVWFGKENIPYGGIIAALTWGLGHWWSKGSLTAGLFTAFCGLVLGSVYLLTNRKAKLTYALLCIIFIL